VCPSFTNTRLQDINKHQERLEGQSQVTSLTLRECCLRVRVKALMVRSL
jgi:hypothetical protein